jgi:DNA-binding FrmR family transcriptional regulator
VHAQIEEEIFYPAVITQLEGVEPDGELFDAKVKVLSEYVKHHVTEEQSQIFPRAKASSLNLVELGASMAERKDDLLAQAPAIPG